MRLPWCLVWKGGGVDPSAPAPLKPVLEVDPPGAGVGSSVFLLWTPGTWGEPTLMDGHFFSLFVGWLVSRCQKWPLSGDTDERGWTELYSGKWGMVRAGESASRIIGDRGVTDPGRGKRALGGRQPAWKQPVGGTRRSPWTPFRPWGATLLRMLDGVNVRCRITMGTWLMVELRSCRSPLRRWAIRRGGCRRSFLPRWTHGRGRLDPSPELWPRSVCRIICSGGGWDGVLSCC